MSDTEPDGGAGPPAEPDIDRLLDHLEELEETVDNPAEREQVRRTMQVARRIPGHRILEERIQKYTTRDLAEAFVGGILLSLPMLVEDGIFTIAEWLLATTVAGIPVFLVGNVTFIVLLTIGLIYWSDIREVQITNPILGIVPRRLVGVLAVSFLSSALLFALWGRHLEVESANTLDVFAPITVVWAAAAFGAALGDILPGESRGYDITVENLDEIVGPDDE